MSIIQFLRILWAWRWITVVAAVSCLAGAVIVILVVPPRWEAHTRIMLDVVKPDPLTGQAIQNASAYAGTQAELIKDYTVAGKAVDQLGWLSDPAFIEAYQHRPKKDVRDFRRWVAQRVIDGTDAGLVPGTNILDITYAAPSPNEAKTVADAVTKAYVESSVEFRRGEASRNADWFEAQAQKGKADLDAASDAEAAYQRQTGIILQDEKTDVDSARLHALASDAAAGAPVFVAPITTTGSAAGAELAQVDAAISQASQSLGPNHPELQALRSKRAALATEVAQEQAAARAASGAASSGVGALDRAMASAKSKVLGQSAELEHLRQLHAEVELRRDQYNKTASRAAELRQEAMIGDTGLTVLGPAAAPKQPKFPNKPLILGGSLGLGIASGILAGLLLELLGRRVRGMEDLKSIDAPVLSVVPATATRRSRVRSTQPRGAQRLSRLRTKGAEV